MLFVYCLGFKNAHRNCRGGNGKNLLNISHVQRSTSIVNNLFTNRFCVLWTFLAVSSRISFRFYFSQKTPIYIVPVGCISHHEKALDVFLLFVVTSFIFVILFYVYNFQSIFLVCFLLFLQKLVCSVIFA